MVKFGELCGSSMVMRCQLPNEDMDLLVTVTSDEELAAVIEEYDRSSPASKIKVVLSPPKSLKTVSPVSSTASSVDSSDSRSTATIGPRLPPSPPMVAGRYAGPPLPPPPLYPTTAAYRCRSQFSPSMDFNHNVQGGGAARLHYHPLHDGRCRRCYWTELIKNPKVDTSIWTVKNRTKNRRWRKWFCFFFLQKFWSNILVILYIAWLSVHHTTGIDLMVNLYIAWLHVQLRIGIRFADYLGEGKYMLWIAPILSFCHLAIILVGIRFLHFLWTRFSQ